MLTRAILGRIELLFELQSLSLKLLKLKRTNEYSHKKYFFLLLHDHDDGHDDANACAHEQIIFAIPICVHALLLTIFIQFFLNQFC